MTGANVKGKLYQCHEVFDVYNALIVLNIMKPFVPDSLPIACRDDRRLIALVGRANAELARYDGLLQAIINPAVLLSPLTTEEAVLSSKIEGTNATVDEVLEQEAGLIKEGEKGKDIQEIVNYRRAMFVAREFLVEANITLALVRQLHKTLLTSARGQDKRPGEFRRDQNWIGRPGTPIEQATFVPPAPLRLLDHLQAWERYVASDDDEFLIQAAVVHAQFELLHPFSDGNGRIGRILVPLFMYQKKLISQPVFYLSAYLEQHRETYYERLNGISIDADWNGWIEFFLDAVQRQARENIRKVKIIKELYEEMKEKIVDITHSQYAIQVLDAIFSTPIFRTVDFVTKTGMQKQTVFSLLRQLKDAGILVELVAGRGRRPAILCFPRLLNSAEGKDIVGV